MAEELIVLVDDDGRAIGAMPKPLVHHGETPLHRAFSAYLFDDDDRLLVTRRAITKQTFPGMWTNTVCGHPGPGEADDDAIARRARQELGVQVADLRPAVPGYRYRAEFRGVVENEICPVYLGRLVGRPVPEPSEVDDWELLGWSDFRARQETGAPDEWSPWCREQARLIETAGLVPGPQGSEVLPGS
ncbi:isopentenyl-diphosphate Delta-isomerase [Goekera deserti]|uniref:isopentenyl-diphosphate Delta-isomerase n=1 Tax=Goekera deserti TaxID=2497753 RepID=UPI001F2FC1AB|nr:isopentenyl-diphosphate Delta-isomerase [Goekera deserti]